MHTDVYVCTVQRLRVRGRRKIEKWEMNLDGWAEPAQCNRFLSDAHDLAALPSTAEKAREELLSTGSVACASVSN